MTDKEHLFNVIWGWKSPTWNDPIERVMHQYCTREQGLYYVENYYSTFEKKTVNYWEAPADRPNEIQYVKMEKCN